MSELIARILRDAFRRYYSTHDVPAPPKIEQREFGVGDYGRKIVRRHMSFSSPREFRRYLREETPLYISYSVGYFERPDATPMGAKGFLGSDLIFEFDADELGLFSPKDVWICHSCGARGFVEDLRGFRVGYCPKCGEKTEVIMFPDPDRDEKLREEVKTLVNDFLISDFGLSKKEISVNFSGNRGYHIHVRSSAFFDLDKEARKEIVEYITGQGIDVRYFFDVSSSPPRGPSPSDPGWLGRVARSVISALKTARDVSDLVRLGVDARIARRLIRDRDILIYNIRRGLWPLLDAKGDAFSTINRLVRALSPYMGKEIDTNTSVDIHRLIRVPGTIHGGTGLLAAPVSNLSSFDPYRDAVALPSRPYLELEVDIAPEFGFAGESFGPYVNQKVELPLHVSIYLISRGVARWILTSSG